MRASARAGVIGAALLCCTLAGCGLLSYGPEQDRSRFEGAVLMPDHTVLLSFSHLVYRPAEGLAAFPDGGVPKYLKDEAVLATYHIPTDRLRILRRERNKRWTDGQGRFGLQRAKGFMALVTQGGQLRDDLSTNAYEDWLLDVATGEAQPIAWREELAERGLKETEMYLVDARGTLLFVTRPLAAPEKGSNADAWIWIHTPGGNLVRVAQTSHYERMAGDEAIYWIPETRRFKAFHVTTLTTRDLPDYRVPPQEDVVEGILVDSDGQRLRFGRKGEGGWVYESLPLEPGRLK